MFRRLTVAVGSLALVGSMLGAGPAPRAEAGATLRLAYVTWGLGGHTLTVVDRDGTDARVIAGRSCCIGTLSWAPDASALVYENYATPGELRVVSADGRRDSSFVPLPFVSHPRWSPDGRRVAFQEFVPLVPVGLGFLGETHIMVVDRDGSNPRLISAGLAYGPQWSPDGKHLVYENLAGLYVSSVDGPGVPTRITPVGMSASTPAWAPNGRSIAFLGKTDSELTPADIYVVGPDGSGLRKAGGASYCCVSWAPDSKRITFATSDADGNVSGISVVDVSTGTIARLTRSADWLPAWSPDGLEIAFLRNPGSSEPTLAVMRADGSSVRAIATGPIAPYFEWSRR